MNKNFKSLFSLFLFLFISSYFFYTSFQSQKTINYLQIELKLLEKKIYHLSLEKKRLIELEKNFDSNEAREYQLNQKRWIKSNEILVNLQIPPIQQNNKNGFNLKLIYLFLPMILMIIVTNYYRSNKKIN